MNHIKEFVNPAKIHEQLFIGYLWKNPSLYGRYKSNDIDESTFTERKWFFYFCLGKAMFESGLNTFDDVSTYSFISSRGENDGNNIVIKYNEYGGYEPIAELIEECDPVKNNHEYHFNEIMKYRSLRKMQESGLINVENKDLVEKLCKMSYKQVQSFFQFNFRRIFTSVHNGNATVYNLGDRDGLYEEIQLMNQGDVMGLPFHDAPLLTNKIKGWRLGTLNYLVLSSGVGKTSFGTEKAIISLLEHEQKGIIFANEENIRKFRRLILATVSARILNKAINREKMSQGKFDQKTMAILREAADWVAERDLIKFVEMEKYRVEDVVHYIELFGRQGYKHVFFDTFKPELSSDGLQRWEAFSNAAQAIHDTIKESAMNCAMLATVQLKIGQQRRYLDLDCIGKSKEIVEVADTVLMGRMMYDDEYPDSSSKYELKPYRWVKSPLTNKWERQYFELDRDKKYMILFIAKNREGSADEQIIYEANYNINSWIEKGLVMVPRTEKTVGI